MVFIRNVELPGHAVIFCLHKVPQEKLYPKRQKRKIPTHSKTKALASQKPVSESRFTNGFFYDDIYPKILNIQS